MEHFDAECPQCLFVFEFDAQHLGKKARCMECKGPVDLVPVVKDDEAKAGFQIDPEAKGVILQGLGYFFGGLLGAFLFTFLMNYVLENAWDSGKTEVSVPKLIFMIPAFAVFVIFVGFGKVAQGLGALKRNFLVSAIPLGILGFVGVVGGAWIVRFNDNYTKQRQKKRAKPKPKEPEKSPSFGVAPKAQEVKVVKKELSLSKEDLARMVSDFSKKKQGSEALHNAFRDGTKETQLELLSQLVGALFQLKLKTRQERILEEIVAIRNINAERRTRSFQVFAEFNNQLLKQVGAKTIPWRAMGKLGEEKYKAYSFLHALLFQTAIKDFRQGNGAARDFIVRGSAYPKSQKLKILPVEGRSVIRTEADKALSKMAQDIAKQK